MRRGAFAIALLLCVTSLRAQQTPPPSFAVQSGAVTAALPTSVLQHAGVRKQLGSGLTTTFLAVARQRDPKLLGGARIEVRYDLWDEVWIVKRIEFDGRIDRQRLDSIDALERWWHAPVRLLAARGDRIALQLDLTVLPFSAAEEQDAREWIAKSGGAGTAAGGGGALVDALIGTTFSPKPITSYRWTVDLR